MPTLTIKWDANGRPDYFEYYRSESAIDESTLPEPIVVNGLEYVDTTAEAGKKYYIKIASVRENIRKFSAQVTAETVGKVLVAASTTEIINTGSTFNLSIPVCLPGDLILVAVGGLSVFTTSSVGFVKNEFNEMTGSEGARKLAIFTKQATGTELSITVNSSTTDYSYAYVFILRSSISSKQVALKRSSIASRTWYPIDGAIASSLAFPEVSFAGTFQLNIKLWNQHHNNYVLTDTGFNQYQSKTNSNKMVCFSKETNTFAPLSIAVSSADVSLYTTNLMASFCFDLIDK